MSATSVCRVAATTRMSPVAARSVVDFAVLRRSRSCCLAVDLAVVCAAAATFVNLVSDIARTGATRRRSGGGWSC